MSHPKRLSTKAASQYLAEVEGIKVTPGTLEVWRCLKKGPEYRKIHNRVYYDRTALENFAQGDPCKTIDCI